MEDTVSAYYRTSLLKKTQAFLKYSKDFIFDQLYSIEVSQVVVTYHMHMTLYWCSNYLRFCWLWLSLVPCQWWSYLIGNAHYSTISQLFYGLGLFRLSPL